MKTPLFQLIIPALVGTALALSSAASAQEPPAATVTQPVPAIPEAVPSDPDAAFRAFHLFARREQTRRIVGGAGGVVFGAATMGVGAYVAGKTDTSSTPWLVMGGVFSGLSLLGMIVPSDAERVASRMSSSAEGHSEAEAAKLLTAWKSLARSSRVERLVGSSVGLLLGAGSLTTGIALASGAGELSDSEQAAWGGGLLGAGVALISGSVFNLFAESDAESSYKQFMATESPTEPRLSRALKLNVATSPTGFFLGATGTF